MRTLTVVIVLLAVMIGGCGVNKQYVDTQIQESEGRTEAKIAAVEGQAAANAEEVAKLKSLAAQLQKDVTDISKATGFENYQVIWEGTIAFGFDSWEISDIAKETLMEAGQTMEQNPSSLVEIAGHTDRTGSTKYNLLLGEKRASAAKMFLAENFGLSLYRLFTISYGESKQVALPDEKDANKKNRRVGLKIWGPVK